MERTLPLIVFRSKVKGLIRMNDTIVGSVSQNEPLTAPVSPSCIFYIAFEPLENPHNCAYLPFSRAFQFLDGKLLRQEQNSCIRIGIWPDGVYHLHITPPMVLLESREAVLPRSVCQKDWEMVRGRPFVATVFEDNGLNLAIEDRLTERMHYLYPLKGAEGKVSIENINTGAGVCGDLAVRVKSDYAEWLYITAYDGKKILPLFSHEGWAFETGKGYIKRISSGRKPTMLQSMEIWSIENCVASLKTQSTGFFSVERKRPETPEDAVTGFLEALRMGSENETMGYIAPKLKNGLAFDDLQEFLGGFTEITKPLWASGTESGVRLALEFPQTENSYMVRIFIFEVTRSSNTHSAFLIENISED